MVGDDLSENVVGIGVEKDSIGAEVEVHLMKLMFESEIVGGGEGVHRSGALAAGTRRE
ncbi:UNVERIFIED_CONTAM: hypothetical protein Sradi_5705200 [Sesamum radiatum]|uniref:Uncharacterized protein n=1 Tax=Sesamum radiatum TaxID=300843 RepID=A0AAW2L386_SESRA